MSVTEILNSTKVEQTLVSVIIPCYNHSAFLPALFGSLIAQTYQNFEVIFVDDCSQDRSWELATEYASQLRSKGIRVELIRNASNLRTGRSVIRASKLCQGDLISILDSDDYYCASRIERCVQFFDTNPDFGAVHSDAVFVMSDGRHQIGVNKNSGRKISQGWIFEDLICDYFVLAGSLMMRREFFLRCWNSLEYLVRDYKAGDFPSVLNLSRITKIGYVDEPLFFYRVLSTSLSHSTYPGELSAFRRSVSRIRQDARLGLLQPKPGIV